MNNKKPTPPRSSYKTIERAIVGVIVLLLFGLAIYWSYRSYRLVSQGTVVQATCTKVETRTSGTGTNRRSRTTYSISYPVEGRGNMQGTINGEFTGLRQGGTIEVLYDPRDPTFVQANRFWSLWGWSIIIGGITLTMGSILLRPKRKQAVEQIALSPQPTPSPSQREFEAKKSPCSPLTWIALGTVAVLLLGGVAWGFVRNQAAHAFPIRAIDISPDGTKIVSASTGDDFAEVVLWDLEEKRKVAKLAAGEGGAIWVRFLNGSGSAALMHCLLKSDSSYGITPGQLVLLDLETGRELASRSTQGYLTKTVVLPKSDRVVVLSWDSIELLQTDLQPITTLSSGSDLQFQAAAVDSDEKILAVSGKDQVYVWDLETQTPLPSLTAEGTRFDKLAISRDGDWIATTIDSNSIDQTQFPVQLWNRKNPKDEVRTIMFEHEISHLAFVPGDPDRLLIVSGRDRLTSQTTLYSLAGEHQETLHSGTTAVDTIALSADGTDLLLNFKRAGGAELWDLSANSATQVWNKQPFPLENVIFSPDASSLIGSRDQSTLRVLDTSSTTQEFEGVGYHRPFWVWPVGTSAAGVLFFLCVLQLSKLADGKTREKREAIIDQVTARLGWEQSSSISVEALPDFEFLKQRAGGHFEFAVVGPSLDREILMGWFMWTTRSNDRDRTHREFCFIYPDTDSKLPDLYIFPEDLVAKITALAGWQDIDLDRTESLRKFSIKHVLRSSQPDRAADVITDQFAEFLCEHPGWSIESLDGSLLLSWKNVISFNYSRSRQRDPQSIIGLQQEAESIAGLLFGIR
ncbi:hypothetical protein EC9_24930 [Rosistilla ulvae]|uniref:DUF3592 domain-containing protein n=2 Tax=Rosistilla ulvae TaxID=1930277 RepID=A0A517M0A9_9BACT|nr:hypothetical protein EC9_24930 [Rosistilla ulvae]